MVLRSMVHHRRIANRGGYSVGGIWDEDPVVAVDSRTGRTLGWTATLPGRPHRNGRILKRATECEASMDGCVND
jgi:hypothetical protein